MQFDLYVPRQSWLHRLDPRTKLLVALTGMVICLFFQRTEVLAGVLASSHLLLLLAHVPGERVRWLWKRMLPLTVMIMVLQPFFASGTESHLLWRVGPLRWTEAGVLSGVVSALRVNAMAFVAAGMLFTTEPTLLVRGLVKLGLPYEWGLTASLAIRYLPTTYGLYQSIHESHQARGWDPGRGSYLRRIRSHLPMLVAVMIAALRMSDNLGMALAARGFGAPYRRTTLRDIRLRPVDWAVMAGALFLLTASLILRFAQG
jgi:energy-coupling factor transport system permease protein